MPNADLRSTASCRFAISFSGCGQKDFPGIYTNVSVVSEWIEQNAAEEACPSGSSSGQFPRRSPRFEGEGRQGSGSDSKRRQLNSFTAPVMLLWFCNLLVLSELLSGANTKTRFLLQNLKK